MPSHITSHFLLSLSLILLAIFHGLTAHGVAGQQPENPTFEGPREAVHHFVSRLRAEGSSAIRCWPATLLRTSSPLTEQEWLDLCSCMTSMRKSKPSDSIVVSWAGFQFCPGGAAYEAAKRGQQRQQQLSETVDQYVTKLRAVSSSALGCFPQNIVKPSPPTEQEWRALCTCMSQEKGKTSEPLVRNWGGFPFCPQ